ncbi:MAG: YdeI/OmpD-associated family protein [Saprospiraceae bacterium]|nr:YdeI/OmpD-associated family protein [Saprospiraceae bacterium]
MFKLIRAGLMTPAGLAAVGDQLGKEDDPLVIPDDVLQQLTAEDDVWRLFQSFPLNYRKLRIGFVMECRKNNLPESDKRLAYLIKMTRLGKQYGTMVE